MDRVLGNGCKSVVRVLRHEEGSGQHPGSRHQDYKFEARSPKYETNNNDRNTNVQNSRIKDHSRKDAKGAKHKQDYKFEARNPKYETNSNYRNINDQNERH